MLESETADTPTARHAGARFPGAGVSAAVVLLLMLGALRASGAEGDVQARIESARKIAASRDRRHAPELARRLFAETEPAARASLVDALAEADPEGSQAAAIDAALADPDAGVRLEAVAAVGRRGERAPAGKAGKEARAAVAAALEKTLLGDKNAGVRLAAAFWLAAMRSPGSVVALGKALAQDIDPNVRAQAARSLTRLGAAGIAAAREELKKAEGDSDERVRKIAHE